MVCDFKLISIDQKHGKQLLSYLQNRDELYQTNLEKQKERSLAWNKEQHQRIINRQKEEAQVFRPLLLNSGLRVNPPIPPHHFLPNQLPIILPQNRKRHPNSPNISFNRSQIKTISQLPELLVPIRLDLELEGNRVKDTFTWNVHEPFITPEKFAEVLCADLKVSLQTFMNPIAASIREQVDDFVKHAGYHYEAFYSAAQEDSAIDIVNADLRIPIKLDITVGSMTYADQIDWDICATTSIPELYAEKTASEHGLGGEFRTAIAHSIREQVNTYLKSLIVLGYAFDGSPIPLEELAEGFLPKVEQPIRSQDFIPLYTPRLHRSEEEEIERVERDKERDSRRKRRQYRSRLTSSLPEREPIKTCRTAIPFSSPSLFAFNPRQAASYAKKLHKLDTLESMLLNELREYEKIHQPPAPSVVPPGSTEVGSDAGTLKRSLRQRTVVKTSEVCLNCGNPIETFIHGRRVQVDKDICDECEAEHERENAAAAVAAAALPEQVFSHFSYVHQPPPIPDRPIIDQDILARRPLQRGRPKIGIRGEEEDIPQSSGQQGDIPGWLTVAFQRLKGLYPNESFEIINLGSDMFRVRCNECRGKTYVPGPNQSLNNFENHLKNKAHRKNVENRQPHHLSSYEDE